MKRRTSKPAVVRCAIYTRKSTDEGLEQEFNSLDAQRESGEAYVASQKHEGWVALPERYDDGGYSGGSMDRPALRRLLADVETGRVDMIVVYKVDRLSRSLLDFARIIGKLDEHQAGFVAVTQSFSTSTPMGRLTLNVLMSFAEFERGVISERTRDKMSAARRKGKWTGGPPLLGFDVHPDGGRIVVNEAEAKRVREIFNLYAERQSLGDTVRELNRRGWTTKEWWTRRGTIHAGRPFVKSTLHRLLSSHAYVGQVHYDGTVYQAEHPAIVDEPLWIRVQALLARNARAGGRSANSRYGSLLLGLLHCAPCDAPMTSSYSVKGQRRYRYYTCTRARTLGAKACPTGPLPAGEIERFVLERIRGIGTDPEVLARVAPEAVDALREFELVWQALSPREQARVLQLLVERVVYSAVEETIAVTFRPTQLQSISADHAA